MFNFRHPKPVVDGRAVAVQVVQQKGVRPQTAVLVVGHAPPEQSEPQAPAGDEACVNSQ